MSDSSVFPKDDLERERLQRETQRWQYVKDIARREGMSLSKAAQFYNIDIKVVGADEFSEVVVSEKKEKRANKYAAIDKYCRDNVGTEVTPQQVAEIAGFSYPTAIKYINDRPNVFRKVSRGVYEIRDPEMDKKQEADREKGL